MDGYLVLLRLGFSDEPLGLWPTLEAARAQVAELSLVLYAEQPPPDAGPDPRYPKDRRPRYFLEAYFNPEPFRRLHAKVLGLTILPFRDGMPIRDEAENHVPEPPKRRRALEPMPKPAPKSRKRKARAAYA